MSPLQNFKPEIRLFLTVASIAVVVSVAGISLLRELSPAPTPLPKPQASDTSDFTLSEVEGWQTHRNEEFGFEVKYPEGWSYREDMIVGSVVFVDNSSDQRIDVSLYKVEDITGRGIYYCGDYIGILERCERFQNYNISGSIDWEAAYGFAAVFENSDSSRAFYILYKELPLLDRTRLSSDFFKTFLATFRFVE